MNSALLRHLIRPSTSAPFHHLRHYPPTHIICCFFPSQTSSLFSFTSRYFSSETQEEEKKKKKISFFQRFSIEHNLKNLIHTIGLTDDEDLSRLLSKTVKFGFYGVIGMTFLGTLGIDTKPIIASLGVAGLTAGYALKDAATHFTSGVMLVLQKPFKKGDYIKLLLVVPHEGIVDAIDVRYVHLRTKDNNILLIPCSVVYANSIIVSSKPPVDWPPLNSSSSTSSASSPSSTSPTSTPPSPDSQKK